MDDEFEIDLVDIVKIIKKRFKLIIFLTISIAFANLTINLRVPKTYSAEATILPVARGSIFAAPYFDGLIIQDQGSDNSKIMVALNTRKITEMVVEDLRLAGSNNLFDFENIVEKISQSSTRKLDASRNLISISVNWSNPEMAANIANSYVDSLGKLLSQSPLISSYLVLDRAITPKISSNIDIKKSLSFGLIAGLSASLGMIFFIEWWQRLNNAV